MRACVVCGCYEVFPNMTHECCWKTHGKSCVFQDPAPSAEGLGANTTNRSASTAQGSQPQGEALRLDPMALGPPVPGFPHMYTEITPFTPIVEGSPRVVAAAVSQSPITVNEVLGPATLWTRDAGPDEGSDAMRDVDDEGSSDYSWNPETGGVLAGFDRDPDWATPTRAAPRAAP